VIGRDENVTSKSKIRKVVLFDLDWTLIYTGGAGVKALDYAFKATFGIPEAMKRVSPDGKTDRAICREMIQMVLNRTPKEDEIDTLCRGYLERLAQEIPQSEGYRILPGVPELLEAIKGQDGILMGLGTGNLEEGARIKLARAGFMKYFQFGGYGSDAEERPKVLKAAIQRAEALAGQRFNAQEVIVIGDNIRDVQAGQAIGAMTIAVATGPMSREDLAKGRPDHLFQDLSDTAAVLHVLTV
jgi:phosphoglycolate phosphatase-like HAD superfamily hydrolase